MRRQLLLLATLLAAEPQLGCRRNTCQGACTSTGWYLDACSQICERIVGASCTEGFPDADHCEDACRATEGKPLCRSELETLLRCFAGVQAPSFSCAADGSAVPTACRDPWKAAARCSCEAGKAGDGRCDYGNNSAACGWDGGDCCASTCKSSTYPCDDFACQDPTAAENSGGDSCAAAAELRSDWFGSLAGACAEAGLHSGDGVELHYGQDGAITGTLGGKNLAGGVEFSSGVGQVTAEATGPGGTSEARCSVQGTLEGEIANGGFECRDASNAVLCSGTWVGTKDQKGCACDAASCCSCCPQGGCQAPPRIITRQGLEELPEGGGIPTSCGHQMPPAGCALQYSLTMYFHGIKGFTPQEIYLLDTLRRDCSKDDPCCLRELAVYKLIRSQTANMNGETAGRWIDARLKEVKGQHPNITNAYVHLVGYSAGAVVASTTAQHIPCSVGPTPVKIDVVTIAGAFDQDYRLILAPAGELFCYLFGITGALGCSIGSLDYDPGPLPACLCSYTALLSGQADTASGNQDPKAMENFDGDWRQIIDSKPIDNTSNHARSVIAAVGNYPQFFKTKCQCKPHN